MHTIAIINLSQNPPRNDYYFHHSLRVIEQIQVHTNHSDFSGAQEYARVIRVIHSIISSACAYWAYAMDKAVVSDLQQRAEQLYH